MRDILVGGTLLASVLGGAVALFAPCCISVMLPAYFATSFGRRRALVSMTFVFAAGVATVILPIAFGASTISRLIVGHHSEVFGVGALMMLALGAATLTGHRLPLPMPGMRPRTARGPASIYSLGLFSGVASSCCAPVLAGVVALSGAASSFGVSLAVGVAYVFGMVAPLFVIALLWDRHAWGDSALLKGRLVRFGGRDLQVASVVSGVLLIGMGVLTLFLAISGPSMPTRGWQVTLMTRLQHWAHNVTVAASGLPGWVVGLVLAGAIGGLAWIAVLQHDDEGDGDESDDDRAALNGTDAPQEVSA